MTDRFYVRESVGLTINPGAQGSGSKPAVEVMVLDRAYCHNVVASRSSRKAQGAAISRLAKIEHVRAAAAAHAERLNAEAAA